MSKKNLFLYMKDRLSTCKYGKLCYISIWYWLSGMLFHPE